MENNEIKITEDILKSDPVCSKAMEEIKKLNKKIEPVVNEILELLSKKLDDEIISSSDACLILGKSLVYSTQRFCTGMKHFEEELAISTQLASSNVFQSLGANAYDNELNKNSVVTFNGEFDKENFNVRRLSMIAGSLVDYTFWKVIYNKALNEQMEKEVEE